MAKGSFLPPVGILPKIIGAVIVIAVLAFIFLGSSSFVMGALSDSSATVNFVTFTRKLSLACASGSGVMPDFNLPSAGRGRYYAIGVLNDYIFSDYPTQLRAALGPSSYSKIKACTSSGKTCLCLFKLDFYSGGAIFEDDAPHPLDEMGAAMRSTFVGSLWNPDTVFLGSNSVIAKWSKGLRDSIINLHLYKVNVKVMQCKSFEDMGCIQEYGGEKYPIPLSYTWKSASGDDKADILLWIQGTYKKDSDYAKRLYSSSLLMNITDRSTLRSSTDMELMTLDFVGVNSYFKWYSTDTSQTCLRIYKLEDGTC